MRSPTETTSRQGRNFNKNFSILIITSLEIQTILILSHAIWELFLERFKIKYKILISQIKRV